MQDRAASKVDRRYKFLHVKTDFLNLTVHCVVLFGNKKKKNVPSYIIYISRLKVHGEPETRAHRRLFLEPHASDSNSFPRPPLFFLFLYLSICTFTGIFIEGIVHNCHIQLIQFTRTYWST